jgi:hypothetical protein
VILSDDDIFCADETWLKRQAPQFAGPLAALNSALQRQEKEMIEAALAESAGRVSGPGGAAAKWGLPRPTLDAKIRRLGINKYRFKVQRSNRSRSTPQSHRVCSLNSICSKPSTVGAPEWPLLKEFHMARLLHSPRMRFGCDRFPCHLWVVPCVIVTNRGDLDYVASQHE